LAKHAHPQGINPPTAIKTPSTGEKVIAMNNPMPVKSAAKRTEVVPISALFCEEFIVSHAHLSFSEKATSTEEEYYLHYI